MTIFFVKHLIAVVFLPVAGLLGDLFSISRLLRWPEAVLSVVGPILLSSCLYGVFSWDELILHCLRSIVTYPKASNASLFFHSLTGLLLSDMSAVVLVF